MSLLVRNIQYPSYYPDELGVGGPKELGKDEIMDFLGSDDEPDETIDIDPDKKTPSKDDAKDDKESDEDESKDKDDETDEVDDEVDELKAIEEELEEPTEAQLELVTPVKRREILAKYPKLFKDFPYLETAYYREQQFTEIFPTIPEAREAVEKVQVLENFEQALMNGDTETILKAVKAQDNNVFLKIADDYLGTLSRVDQNAYNHVIGNTIKHVIFEMVNESRSTKNEALQVAAQLLNQFVFGKSDYVPPTKLVAEAKPGDDNKDNGLSEREKQFNERQFKTAQSDLNTRVTNALTSTIARYIDPKESMTDYIKKQASRDAMESLTTLVGGDSRFKVLLGKLWQSAAKDNYSRESVDRIRAAYVSKAKTLLPSVIKKARTEALKGIGKKVSKDKSNDSEDESPVVNDKKRESTPQRKSGQKISSAKDIPSGMSAMEFLMADD